MIPLRILQFASTIAFLISTIAQAETLSIRAEQPDGIKVLNMNNSWNIILEGEIDSDAPARVAEALKKVGSDGADVYISSPGGNLLAGMQIGRMLREAGANTYIGTLISDPSQKIIGNLVGVKYMPGYCLSACTFAFIGGVYRYSIEGSEFGVHRFSSSSGSTSVDLDAAQIMSAAVGAYIREMDVDPSLFDLMVQEGKDGIRVLSNSDMTRLNVVNNGRKIPKWSIEAIEGAQYLRGVQQSIHGQGKAVLTCHKGQMILSSFYQVGSEKAKSIASGGWYHSLLVDGKTTDLPDSVVSKASGSEIYTLFTLTKVSAIAIASSSSMGHAIQMARDVPTYLGYSIDIPAAESQEVGAFIRNCFKR